MNETPKENYGVFTYYLEHDNAELDLQYFSTKATAMKYAKEMVGSQQADESYFVEVWKKPADGLWGNSGVPIFEGEFIVK